MPGLWKVFEDYLMLGIPTDTLLAFSFYLWFRNCQKLEVNENLSPTLATVDIFEMKAEFL